MGKKGTWISAIKRLFTSNSNSLNEGHNKKIKDKAQGRRFKHGSSFFPLFREPSTIEQILGEIDQHNNLFIPPTAQSHLQPQPQPPPQPQPQPQPQSQQQQPQPQPQSQPQPQPQPRPQPKPKPQLQSQQQQQKQPQPKPQLQSQPQPHPQPASSSSGRPASHRLTSPPNISHTPEPTLQQRHLSATRIQAVYRGYMVRRKARGLTGLVRLQQVVTSKSVKRQTVNAMKQMQLLVRVQTQIQSRRIQALENQAPKPHPPNKINPHKQSDEHWDDSLITKEEREARLQRKADAAIKRERAMAYAYSHKLWKDTPAAAAAHRYPWWWKWLERQIPYHATPTQQFATTPSSRPSTPMSSRSTNRLFKGASLYPMKDDDSLRSCPPFSVPNYMSPTASARAKARPSSNPRERERCVTPTTPASESSFRRRFSLPSTPASVGDFSMDSSVGRKPFNRFV